MPSKLSKAESARINGAKSRGPKTPQGRAKSSSNAVTHGITAKTLILQNEQPEQFLEMLQGYVEAFQPKNLVELDVVSEMVAARWRLRRIWRYETAMLDLEMDAQSQDFAKRFIQTDEDIRGTLAFCGLSDAGKGFNTAHRFESHYSRTYRRCLIELLSLQKEPKNSNASTK